MFIVVSCFQLSCVVLTDGTELQADICLLGVGKFLLRIIMCNNFNQGNQNKIIQSLSNW